MKTTVEKLVLFTAVVFVIALAGSGQALGQDGLALFTAKGCTACHGPKGDKPIMPIYPIVNGQSEAYILQQLNDFKSKKRGNGQSQLMWGMAATLTDDDIKKLAKYLATVK
ncbi:MAG: cytochrome c [Deltaproteobacteria bacterium]|nr:cytochrome c [Deltaproteobacteria bacterium]